MNFLKQIICTVLLGIVTYLLSACVDFPQDFIGKTLALIIPGGAGIIVYILMLCILRTQEYKDIAKLFNKSKKEGQTEEN